MALTLYRRHLKACPGAKLPGKVQRQYTDCECPIWIYGHTAKESWERQSLGTADWAVAEAMRRTADAEAKDEKIYGPLLTDCIEKYCASREHELTAGTDLTVRRHLERLRSFAERRTVIRADGLTVNLLEEFKLEGLTGMSDLTKNRAVSNVRCFLKEAFRRDWIQVELAAKMKPHRAKHDQKQPFSDEEVSKILQAASDGRGTHPGHPGLFQTSPLTFRSLIELMLETGMRIGDALRFDPRWLSPGGGVWCYTFHPEKQSRIKKLRPHTVYLSKRLKVSIDSCEWLSKELPFYTAAVTPKGLYLAVYRLLQYVGVKDCRPHRLRDTFAVRSLLKGASLDDVSRLLGHSSVQITESFYAAWVPARARRLEGVAGRLLAEPTVDPQSDGLGNSH